MKGKPIKSGVYAIRNIINGKIYVGSSVNIKRRWCDHRRGFNAGHSNKHLAYAFRKYGKHGFVFEILNRTDDLNEIFEIEEFWIQYFDALNPEKGYNLCLPSAMYNSNSIEILRLKAIQAAKKQYSVRPPSNLSKISREEWIANRLKDPNYSCAKYIKKTSTGQKQIRLNSKPLLQFTLSGELVKEWPSQASSPADSNAIWKDAHRRPRYLTSGGYFWVQKGVDFGIPIPDIIKIHTRGPA